MFSFRSLQWWTGVLLSTLMVLLVVFAYTARRPLCIDSKLVERIDSISDKGTATAYRCSLRKHVDFNQNLADYTATLGPKLQSLERFFDWFGPFEKKINLTIISGDGEHYRIQDQEIFASESILRAKGQLEKAFIRSWFRQKASMSLQSQLLFEESLTDFIYYTYSGSLSLQDPLTGIWLEDQDEAKWPRILSSPKGYCQSIWKSNEHLKTCNDALIDQSPEEISINTLRPLMTQTLIESYLHLSHREQMNLLRSLPAELANFEFQRDFGMSLIDFAEPNYAGAVSQIQNWVQFVSLITQKIEPKFSAYFNNSLQRRGFDYVSPKIMLDVLVFANELPDKQIQEIYKQINIRKEVVIGLEIKETLKMSVSGEALNLNLLGPVQALTGVYFHCGMPKIQDLVGLAQRIEKLVFINSCGQSEFRFEGLFKHGIESFAQQNPKVKFAEFHLPSLVLAIQKLKGQNPLDFLFGKKTESLAPLGWNAPLYDDVKDAYKAQSAIEIVNWYRL